MKEIYGYLIENKRPLLNEVIQNVITNKDDIKTIAFASYPNFDFSNDFDEDYLVELEKKKKKIKPYVVAWDYDAIKPVIANVNWMNNLIYFFFEPVTEENLQFIKNKWDFIYNCVDRYVVELFTKRLEIGREIIKCYDVKEIEYPGEIFGPSGWSTLK